MQRWRKDPQVDLAGQIWLEQLSIIGRNEYLYIADFARIYSYCKSTNLYLFKIWCLFSFDERVPVVCNNNKTAHVCACWNGSSWLVLSCARQIIIFLRDDIQILNFKIQKELLDFIYSAICRSACDCWKPCQYSFQQSWKHLSRIQKISSLARSAGEYLDLYSYECTIRLEASYRMKSAIAWHIIVFIGSEIFMKASLKFFCLRMDCFARIFICNAFSFSSNHFKVHCTLAYRPMNPFLVRPDHGSLHLQKRTLSFWHERNIAFNPTLVLF